VSDLLFDAPFYQAINKARWVALQRLLSVAQEKVGEIRSVIDLGAGPGWFAGRLAEAGYDVLGLEGRPELVEVAREREPGVRFEPFDFDAAALDNVPAPADAVVCFGLLYHLENPLRGLRMCRAMAKRALFLETMTLPQDGPAARLMPENPNETQGMRSLALLLSTDAVVHALQAAGFSRVYRVEGASIGHDDFIDTSERRKRRDVFLACDADIEAPGLSACKPAQLRRYEFKD
jgi:SAM-dependent methyltransferase